MSRGKYVSFWMQAFQEESGLELPPGLYILWTRMFRPVVTGYLLEPRRGRTRRSSPLTVLPCCAPRTASSPPKASVFSPECQAPITLIQLLGISAPLPSSHRLGTPWPRLLPARHHGGWQGCMTVSCLQCGMVASFKIHKRETVQEEE